MLMKKKPGNQNCKNTKSDRKLTLSVRMRCPGFYRRSRGHVGSKAWRIRGRAYGSRLAQTTATVTPIRDDPVRCMLASDHDTVLGIDCEHIRNDTAIDNVQIIHAADFRVRRNYTGVAAFAHLRWSSPMICHSAGVWRVGSDIIDNLRLSRVLRKVQAREVRSVHRLQKTMYESGDIIGVGCVGLVVSIISRSGNPVVIQLNTTSGLQPRGTVDVQCKTSRTLICSVSVWRDCALHLKSQYHVS